MKKISLIVAMSDNQVIGHNNQLLWHLPNDFKHFKNITMGKPIVMGRKTFESIGHALPGRQNIVITRDPQMHFEGCDVAHSVEEALNIAKGDEVIVIGGAEIYARFLPIAHKLYITQVHGNFSGDVVFSDWNRKEWRECSKEEHPVDDKHAYAYTFLLYQRE